MTAPEIEIIIDEIKHDKTHGASELARRAIEVLKIAAQCSRAPGTEEFMAEQMEIGEQLMSARPSIAPIFNMVKYLLDAVTFKAEGLDMESARLLAISEADAVINGSLLAIDRIARHALELIATNDIMLTHSYSSTIIATLIFAYNELGAIKVIITRSGSGRTGEIVAQQLSSKKIPVTFIDDSAAGLYVKKVNKVMVGADRICADAKIINAVGTYSIALASEKAGVPFYVLCESIKFDPRVSSDEVDLEEREPSEVASPGILPADVTIRNPHFEAIPLELVTGVVTEHGVLSPAEVMKHIEKLSG